MGVKHFFFLIHWLFFCIISISKAQTPHYQLIIQEEVPQNQETVIFSDSMYLLVLTENKFLKNWDISSYPTYRHWDSSHYLIEASPDAFDSLMQYGSIYRVNPYWKLSKSLIHQLSTGQKPQAKKYLIKSKTGMPLAAIFPKFSEKFRLVQQYGNYFVIEGSWKNIHKYLVPRAEIEALEEMPQGVSSESLVRDMNLFVNQINYTQRQNPSLNGAGLLVSIQEPLYDIQDLDLINRHRASPFQSDELDPHATDMATIVAGAGNTSQLGRGVAWGAKISSSDNQNLLPAPNEYYQDRQIYIQNHSYGSPIHNVYSALAQAYDQNSWQNPHLLHVFSVGNQGLSQSSDGPYAEIPLFATITGSYKMAKNVLLIGSVDQENQIDPFVSRGPAYDGRIKPDLVAYSQSGSSNAAALVSGIALLMQQAYQKDNPAKALSAALQKACLINSAQDIGPPGPDFLSGYGNVNAHKAIALLQSGQYQEAILEEGQADTLTIEVPQNARNLKISLTWTDREGILESSKALVNDLDLRLLSPDGTLMALPWVLNAFPNSDSLIQEARPGEDHRNTIEQIELRGVLASAYHIVVSAHDIPEGKQAYALAYAWETPDQFNWTYPTQEDALPFDDRDQAYLRWESTYEDSLGRIDLSLDGGQTWTALHTDVALKNSYLLWQLPDTNCQAQLRMRIGSQDFLSDVFTLSRAPNLDFGFNCPDSLLLQWPSINGVKDYLLLSPGLQYLDTLLITQDTSLVLAKQDYPQENFGILPRWPDGTFAQRSLIVNPDLEQPDCFLVGFSVISLDSSQGIQLEVELSSTYQVASLSFERESAGVFMPLGQVTQLDSARVIFVDKSPQEGLNRYQARIRFQNGGQIFTGSDIGYFIQENPIIIYPNPASRNELISLLRRMPEKENFTLRINNTRGVRVFERQLSPSNASLDLGDLPSGMYIYSILEGSLIKQGKLLIMD